MSNNKSSSAAERVTAYLTGKTPRSERGAAANLLAFLGTAEEQDAERAVHGSGDHASRVSASRNTENQR